MILGIDEIKNASQCILAAIDSSTVNILTETLELVADGNTLNMNITNREYYTRVKLDLGAPVKFRATVNASLFLKLIAQTTSETVELTTTTTNLIVKGNGTYKIPLIYDGEKLLELPEINIDNVTASFDIASEILNSINTYNSKELTKGNATKLVQKMYYVDEQGCITFTSGACVNSFTLPTKIKFLLPSRIVKLFKLLKDEQIKFSLGYDDIGNEIAQTKVRFESSNIVITAILACDDIMLNSVPTKVIRGLADNSYPYSITIDKNEVMETINRLALFTNGYGGSVLSKPLGYFKFESDFMEITDKSASNKETIYYDNSVDMSTPYTAILDLNELKATLEGSLSGHVTVNFGNKRAFVIKKDNITNILPEFVEA